MSQLTQSQEDIINEPTEKCEVCNRKYPKDDITTARIDNGENIRICNSCYEALQESCYENFDEEFQEQLETEQAQAEARVEAEQESRAVEEIK